MARVVPHGTTGGLSIAAILPLILTAGKISGAGTAKKFNWIKDAKPIGAASAEASSSENIEVVAAQGYTFVTPKVTKTINIADGSEKQGGTSGEADKLVFTLLEVTPENYDWLLDMRGKPAVCMIPHGITTSGTEAYYYLLGTITSPIEFTGQGNTISELQIEFPGKADLTDGETAGQAAPIFVPGEITQAGDDDSTDAITPAPLVTGDLAELLKGVIVQKIAA